MSPRGFDRSGSRPGLSLWLVFGPALWLALWLAWLGVVASCGGGGAVGRMRFHNQAPIWQVNDREDTAKPAEWPFRRILYYVDTGLLRQVSRVLEVPAPRRARNVNSLDEVPDSTWFSNRIGVRDMTPEEIARGPNKHASIDLSVPWKILSSKLGGSSIGFVAVDGRGDRYLLKFDVREVPVAETAADVVIQRLLWAAGYNVPEDDITYAPREQFTVAEGATLKEGTTKRPMGEADLERIMAQIHREPDGRYRVLTSRFLGGAPIGGIVPKGVRHDDPNDLIPHEDRRDLRGLYAFFAWLEQVDVKEDNALDMWTQDPDDDKVHYVVHYHLDFGKGLGSMEVINRRPENGHTYSLVLDFEYLFKSLPLFGLWTRPWERRPRPTIRGVGVYESENFHPDKWKSTTTYEPFTRRDVYDMFWATKIIMRFTPEHIRAAVEQARYDDPRAAEYMIRVIIERQRITGRYWFSRVNPLDGFTLQETGTTATLCFDDLLVRYRLTNTAQRASSYRLASFGDDGRPLGWQQTLRASAQGPKTACATGLALADTRVGYTIVRIITARAALALEPVEVHIARDPTTGAARIIGVNRR